MKHAIVILGMHRSGTSSVAGALAHLGAAPPLTLLPADWDNPRGFWESRRVIEVNDRLLQAGGSYWRDWRRFDPDAIDPSIRDDLAREMVSVVTAEFADDALIVFKDPRLCRLWPLWEPVFAGLGYDPRFVLPVRSPLEVARSLQRRNAMPVAEGLQLWLRHVLDAEQVTRGRPRCILLWDRFMRDWRAELDRIETALSVRFPDRGPAADARVEDFLSTDLKTADASARELLTGPDTHAWVRTAFEALAALAQTDGDERAFARLDDLRPRFDAASDLFGRSVGALLVDVETAQKARDAARAETARIDRIARRLGDNLLGAEERRQSLAARLAAGEAALDQALTDLRHATASVAAAEAVRADLEEQRDRAIAAHRADRLKAERAMEGAVRVHAAETVRLTGAWRDAETARAQAEAEARALRVELHDALVAADRVRRARDRLAGRLDRLQDAARQARSAHQAEAVARQLAFNVALQDAGVLRDQIEARARADFETLQARLRDQTERLETLSAALARRPWRTAWAAWWPVARRSLARWTRRSGLRRG